MDGIYSWYTSGGGNYTISQWLCDHDANAMKGHEIMFRFWFKPETAVANGSKNYARTEIHYVLNDGTQQNKTGNWTYPTQITWYNPSIWVTIPADTIAIKLIIHGEPDFKAWIDSTFMIVI